MSIDTYNLGRFIEAQSRIYNEVRGELAIGDKRGHWMWFIFPQLKGLGMSSTSEYFGIGGRDEATAYFQHALLGPRLIECVDMVLRVQGKTAEQIFSFPDNLKFRSSLTLFACVSRQPVFTVALTKYFDGKFDSKTLDLLGR